MQDKRREMFLYCWSSSWNLWSWGLLYLPLQNTQVVMGSLTKTLMPLWFSVQLSHSLTLHLLLDYFTSLSFL